MTDVRKYLRDLDMTGLPRPPELRIRLRDLSILVDNATFPCPMWQEDRRRLRLLLLLSETIYRDETEEDTDGELA